MLKTEKLFTKLKFAYNELLPFESCMYNAEKCGRHLPNHSHSGAVYV